MFKTAGVRSIRRVVSAFSIMSFAVLLGACVNSSPPDPGEPKSWVVEKVASKSTAELYADTIAPATFDRSSTKVIDVYTVESGNLHMPDRSEGSLVTVRAVDGSLTALINMPGKRGLLRVDNKGMSTFTLAPALAPDFEDRVPDAGERVGTPVTDSAKSQSYTVDILLGYSRAAEAAGGGDVNANALAQVELVNLELRNSLVTNVSLNLVGIQVIEEDYWIDTHTFNKLPELLSEGLKKSEPDIFFGFFTRRDSGPLGIAAGRMGIGLILDSTVLSHELGHIVGLEHCNPDDVPLYHYGYDNGKTSTIMCGDRTPYYSTPALKDQFGLPRGNAVTADSARVWREQAQRLSSFAPPQSAPTAPGNFVKVGSTGRSITFSWSSSSKAVRYDIYRARTNGVPVPQKIGESTTLTFTATDVSGEAIYFVKSVSFVGLVSPPSNTVVAVP